MFYGLRFSFTGFCHRGLKFFLVIIGLHVQLSFAVSGQDFSGLKPEIVTQPVSKTGVAGFPVELSAKAIGAKTLQFQWFKNDVAVLRGTNLVLRFSAVQLEDAGDYRVEVTNSLGVAPSEVAILTVVPPVEITRQPSSLVKSVGETAVFSIQATSLGTLLYQWFKDQTPEFGGNSRETMESPVPWKS